MSVLVRILDLVDQPVAGIRADLRSRAADGSLLYDHTEKEGPRMRTLKTVEIRREKGRHNQPKEPWLYWTWEKPGDGGFDCGYSGNALSGNAANVYLLIEAQS